jgi:hypothetical protein
VKDVGWMTPSCSPALVVMCKYCTMTVTHQTAQHCVQNQHHISETVSNAWNKVTLKEQIIKWTDIQ